jgi:hypothetical protein
MRVENEIYREWSISFDTEKETFHCHYEELAKEEGEKSFASTRKWIDDFIKKNKVFNPIWAESKSYYYGDKKIKIIGINENGNFIYRWSVKLRCL